MLRNALTLKVKYLFRDCVNLSSPIQMQLYLKPKFCVDFFVPFLESTLNFKHFEKENDCDSYFISEITDCGKVG